MHLLVQPYAPMDYLYLFFQDFCKLCWTLMGDRGLGNLSACRSCVWGLSVVVTQDLCLSGLHDQVMMGGAGQGGRGACPVLRVGAQEVQLPQPLGVAGKARLWAGITWVTCHMTRCTGRASSTWGPRSHSGIKHYITNKYRSIFPFWSL